MEDNLTPESKLSRVVNKKVFALSTSQKKHELTIGKNFDP